nr:MAG TPA: hypothetical protein [Caudoviricetes sp.]
MRIGRVSRVRINRLPTNSVIRRSPSSGACRYSWLCIKTG